MLDSSLPASEPRAAPAAPDPAQAAPGADAEQLHLQATEYLQGWQRAKADYANLKRETDLKLVELTQHANEELLRELLPLVDYLKHALRAVPEDQRGQSWVEGVRHIQAKFEQVLAYYGVKELEVLGEQFNPELHESVGEVAAADVPPGAVAEVVRTGFKLHDRLLQPARVKLARAFTLHQP